MRVARRRDDFSAATRKAIAARAGYRCSDPNCRAPTSGPALGAARAVNIGKAAHIKAASPGGPRYDALMSKEERTDPQNGVWLCSVCADLIDVDPLRYSEESLKEWKVNAEREALLRLGKPFVGPGAN